MQVFLCWIQARAVAVFFFAKFSVESFDLLKGKQRKQSVAQAAGSDSNATGKAHFTIVIT